MAYSNDRTFAGFVERMQLQVCCDFAIMGGLVSEAKQDGKDRTECVGNPTYSRRKTKGRRGWILSAWNIC
jgi:hypothetical protein